LSSLAAALLAELDDEALDELAERLAPRLVGAITPEPSPSWLNTPQAAEYLCAPVSRVYDLRLCADDHCGV
jgi:hypothetical protein